MTKLEKKYNESCNDYIKEFCNKQGLEFDGWIGDQVGGISMFGDLCFAFHDIVWDINSKQRKGLITNWYYESLDHVEQNINYTSYTWGMRFQSNN